MTIQNPEQALTAEAAQPAQQIQPAQQTQPAEQTHTAEQARLHSEIQRRRTFAIISHPDAGKTTITEKLLLYGGAIQQAGSVTAHAGTAHTKSDWMSIEQQRGISISSSALTVEFMGRQIGRAHV